MDVTVNVSGVEEAETQEDLQVPNAEDGMNDEAYNMINAPQFLDFSQLDMEDDQEADRFFDIHREEDDYFVPVESISPTVHLLRLSNNSEVPDKMQNSPSKHLVRKSVDNEEAKENAINGHELELNETNNTKSDVTYTPTKNEEITAHESTSMQKGVKNTHIFEAKQSDDIALDETEELHGAITSDIDYVAPLKNDAVQDFIESLASCTLSDSCQQSKEQAGQTPLDEHDGKSPNDDEKNEQKDDELSSVVTTASEGAKGSQNSEEGETKLQMAICRDAEQLERNDVDNNKNMQMTAQGLPKKVGLGVTIPKPFNFHQNRTRGNEMTGTATADDGNANTASQKYTFKARAVPLKVLQPVRPVLNSQIQSKLTKPRELHFASDDRIRERQEKKASNEKLNALLQEEKQKAASNIKGNSLKTRPPPQMPKSIAPSTSTKVKPFSFEDRNKELLRKKELKIQEAVKTKQEENGFKFRANPVPSFISKKVPSKNAKPSVLQD